ncbi:Glucan synthesis regulatory protein [Termitomyces sp. J132]|nr:Glucan synthesis regulatory protein [Termitomyces sp. J132]
MGWLSSFFSSADSSQYSRKGQALSSTHEAFSLPTSSPTFSHPHPDAFDPDTLHTPDLEASMNTVYTYPPQGRGSYGYVHTFAGLSSRPASASLLPSHHDRHHTSLSPTSSFPPLASSWNRIRAWLHREYPELGDTLNYGILPLDLSQIEMQFGFALPPVIRESYLCCDGQEAESAAGCSEGLFFGLKLLPLEDVLQEWKFWREVDGDPATGANPRLREAMQSIPPGWIRKEYSQRGWIPLIADKVGNYIGVDLNPDESGSVGQVIIFGRDFDTKVVLWRGDGPGGWAKWLASFAEELESGEGFEIGSGDTSDDSEDDLGYESYFYDGTGRGQGDGGGDTGNSGLRLTGEYRGWNVLEAWADRSLRRWHDAGVITDISLLPLEETKEPEPEVLNIRHESSVDVGIPILTDGDAPIPAPASIPELEQLPHSASLPSISVTRPPVPIPVELPQPSDIFPDSPPESLPSSFDEDLESGRSIGRREVSDFVSRRPSPREHSNSNASSNTSISALVVPQQLQTSLSDTDERPTSPPASHVQTNVPDLLADSAPSLYTRPIAPLSPGSAKASASSATPIQEPSLDDEKKPAAAAITQEGGEPDNTVRLVGGGGVVGIAKPEEKEDKARVGSSEDVASDAASSDSAASSAKAHKKTKSSLASLKKLGLGLKRNSTSSLKGMESSIAT